MGKEFVEDLQKRVMKECDNFSEDVKFWAEYKTGVKQFKPWLEGAETRSKEGLAKPQTLDEANAMFASVNDFAKACVAHLDILNNAEKAANKMTTHKEADDEVAELKGRYDKVKVVSTIGARRSTPWSRNGSFWTTLSMSSTPGWPRTVVQRASNSTPWRRWSPLWASSRTSSRRRKSSLRTCNSQLLYHSMTFYTKSNHIVVYYG